jgi:hypothetical protein
MGISVREDDVILIGGTDSMWVNCLLRVVEVRTWGVVGSVMGPNQSEYPLRVNSTDIAGIYRKVAYEH